MNVYTNIQSLLLATKASLLFLWSLYGLFGKVVNNLKHVIGCISFLKRVFFFFFFMRRCNTNVTQWWYQEVRGYSRVLTQLFLTFNDFPHETCVCEIHALLTPMHPFCLCVCVFFTGLYHLQNKKKQNPDNTTYLTGF